MSIVLAATQSLLHRNDPAVPFRGSEQVVIDWLRVLSILTGVITAMLLVRIAQISWRRRQMPFGSGRVYYVLSLFLLTVSVTFTEIGRLGHPLTWRLPVNITALVLIAVGLFHTLQDVTDSTGLHSE